MTGEMRGSVHCGLHEVSQMTRVWLEPRTARGLEALAVPIPKLTWLIDLCFVTGAVKHHV